MTHPILLVLLLALVSCQKNPDTKTTTPPKPRPAIPRVYTDSIAKMLDLAMVPAARLPIGTNTYWKHYLRLWSCLLYTSPSPRDRTRSRMPSSA